MKAKKITLFVILISISVVSSSFRSFFCKKQQGIQGIVTQVSGNQMPSPDIKRSAPAPFPTKVFIYERTLLSQTKEAGKPTFYSSVITKLIKTIATDSAGRFKVTSPPGEYSLFVEKNGLLYANSFNEHGAINTVVVIKKKWSELNIRVNDGAVY